MMTENALCLILKSLHHMCFTYAEANVVSYVLHHVAAFADAGVLKSVVKIGAKVVDAALPIVATAGPHIDTGGYVHNDPDWRSWKTMKWDERAKNAAQLLEDEANAEAIEALLQE
ncbi:uncharacterized protein LOC144744513 [Ciona intestinalis]